jgi:hypothetical protein
MCSSCFCSCRRAAVERVCVSEMSTQTATVTREWRDALGGASTAKAVWEKREDLPSLKPNFLPYSMPKRMKNCSSTKRSPRNRDQQSQHTYMVLSTSTRANRSCSRIVGLKLKSRDDNGDLVSPTAHLDAMVRPRERAATILAQLDREMTS